MNICARSWLPPMPRAPFVRSQSPSGPPKVLEPVRGKLGIAHRVLDVLVPEPGLQRPGVVAGVGQRVAATVAQHVRMDREWHAGALAEARKQCPEALGRHRAAALAREHVRASRVLLPLQAPQSPDRVTLLSLHPRRATLA